MNLMLISLALMILMPIEFDANESSASEAGALVSEADDFNSDESDCQFQCQ
jgi:hypothetical protein